MGGPVLEASGITVRFGGINALTDVSLEASTGEVVGVIGPNGAGKTTLFNVISGFVRPNSGGIRLDGRPVRLRPHRLARAGLARTIQGVGLWPGLTVLENVMAGARVRHGLRLGSAALGVGGANRADATERADALNLMEQLGLSSWSDRLPPSLPYGVQKQTALARALISQPRLLLLDEPASGLSESEMSGLADLIRSLRTTTGVVLVEHHMDLVMSVCDRIVVLDFGRVIASGSPEEIGRDPEVLRAYLGQEIGEDDVVGLSVGVASDPEVAS